MGGRPHLHSREAEVYDWYFSLFVFSLERHFLDPSSVNIFSLKFTQLLVENLRTMVSHVVRAPLTLPNMFDILNVLHSFLFESTVVNGAKNLTNKDEWVVLDSELEV